MGKKTKSNKVKTIAKWSGLTFGVLVLALLILPSIYKDEIKEMALKEANKSLLADVAIKDFDLTFISTFPHITARLEGLKVTGTDKNFKGVVLTKMESFEAHLNFWSVVGGDKVEIEGITLNKPEFDVRVLKDGTANYDIVKPDSVKKPEDVEEPSPFSLQLKKYTINNASIRFDDQSMNLYTDIKNLSHVGKGDMTQDIIDFETTTNMDAFTYTMDGISYLKKVKTNIVMNILMEFTEKTSKFTLKDNVFELNALKFSLDGFYEMLEKKDNMDLKLVASEATFKDFLSLIPSFYQSGYESMIATGSLAMHATIKGILDDVNMPGWNAGIEVKNASIQYAGLPQSIKNIAVQAGSSFSGGADMDKMLLDVSKFHADFAGNTLDMNLHLRNPMTDPLIDTKILANVNLATLGQVMPMAEGESYKGKLKADIRLNGKMSTIEEERYEDFKAEGLIELKDVLYKSKDLPAPVEIADLQMHFTPKNVALKNLSAKMGASDFTMQGTIDNYLAYTFRDELLQGNFSFTSTNLDLDELMGTSTTETTSTEETTSSSTTEVFLVPNNFNITLNSDIKNIKYNGITITNTKGSVGIKEEIASLNNLTMGVLGGTVGLDGSYNTQDHHKPKVNFSYDIQQIAIADLAKNFVTIDKLAPIAKFVKGKISTSFTMKTDLLESMEPNLSSLSGAGDIASNEITISGYAPLTKLASELKMDKLAKQTIKDFKAKFKFENGKISLTPFTVKLGKINTDVSGSASFEQDLDYKLLLNIPREEIPATALKAVEQGLQKINGLPIQLKIQELPAIIPVPASITGKMTNPIVKVDMKEAIGNLTGNLKNSVKDAVKQVKDSVKTVVKEKVTEKINDVKEDLNKKKQALLADAQKEADKVKAAGKQAADIIRQEGKKQGDALIAEAGSNPLKKKAAEVLAEKAKKQAEDKASKTEQEANQKADAIMNAARQKADQIK
jgi:hypothetical protein